MASMVLALAGICFWLASRRFREFETLRDWVFLLVDCFTCWLVINTQDVLCSLLLLEQ